MRGGEWHTEPPSKPDTWWWCSSTSLPLHVIEDAHGRGLCVRNWALLSAPFFDGALWFRIPDRPSTGATGG